MPDGPSARLQVLPDRGPPESFLCAREERCQPTLGSHRLLRLPGRLLLRGDALLSGGVLRSQAVAFQGLAFQV